MRGAVSLDHRKEGECTDQLHVRGCLSINFQMLLEAERTHFICENVPSRRRRRRNVFFIFSPKVSKTLSCIKSQHQTHTTKNYRRTPPQPAHTSTPTSTSKAAWTSKESDWRETKVKRQLPAQPAIMAASLPLSSHSVASMNGNCCG